MKIGIHGKEFTRQFAPTVLHIFEILSRYVVDLYVSSKFESHLKLSEFRRFKWTTFESNNIPRDLDVLISIGGDGTLLESVSYIGPLEIPILGINTGRLGFLATISRDETEKALGQLLAGAYTLDKRSMLRLESSKNVFGSLDFALNDFTVVKKDISSMITIHTFIDGEFLNSYWADGLIVATPTGSTGYSLSCGGPLIFPRSGNFVITAVSPHNLTVRPIVVPDSAQISFRVEGRSKKFLVSLDSRMATVDSNVELKVIKAGFYANLIQLEGHSYFKTLRQKLNWGLDVRN